jgi:hypothetical protein
VNGEIQFDGEDLSKWWIELAHADLRATLPKAIEYSSHDLVMTGRLMQVLVGDGDGWSVGPAELTCWFYLLSKVTRAIGAIKDQNQPSEDTIRDIRVYATMIARIRANGRWPG